MTPVELAYLDRLPVGRRIALLRNRRGWNRKTLAGFAGLSASYIDKIERGVRPHIRLTTLHRIEDALGVPNVLVTRPVTAPAGRRVAA